MKTTEETFPSIYWYVNEINLVLTQPWAKAGFDSEAILSELALYQEQYQVSLARGYEDQYRTCEN